MDADLLRLLLFVVGIAFILGIYFRERNKKENARIHAIKQSDEFDQPDDEAEAESQFSETTEDEFDEPSVEPARIEPSWGDSQNISPSTQENHSIDESESKPADTSIELMIDPESEIPQTTATRPPLGQVKKAPEPPPYIPEMLKKESSDREEMISEELSKLNQLVKEESTEPEVLTPYGKQTEFSFAAEEEEPIPDGAPEMIVQLNVVPMEGRIFGGEKLSLAIKEQHLVFGEMSVFHRMDDTGKHSLFGVASMVEPGTFPDEVMSTFSTPGLLLFARLPGYRDSISIFSDMLATAERLASLLGGHLQDEVHSDLSKQRIENMREEILEHRRQVQLARRRK
ncbi:MAG: cell division protein ZipA [Gammaproteobacteria bacterium]|nr:cell division protein ZipA [Gammaproteobacteria bacterium]